MCVIMPVLCSKDGKVRNSALDDLSTKSETLNKMSGSLPEIYKRHSCVFISDGNVKRFH